jgi:hypothetical protein
MTPEQFDQTLRQFIRREPFQPFVVELIDGRRFEFERPEVGFGGGTAGFISDTDGLVGFSFDQVREVRLLTHEAAP